MTAFQIDSSGTITTRETLDYETWASYDLIVKATDSRNPKLSETVSVLVNITDVNEGPPEFSLDLYEVNLDEHSAFWNGGGKGCGN